MFNERDVLEADIHRYVDGVLDAKGRERVEAALRRNDELRRCVEEYVSQRKGLRILFAAVDAELRAPIPAMNMRAIVAPRFAGAPHAAFGALMLLLGAAGGWSGALVVTGRDSDARYAVAPDPVADEGFRAHRVFVVDRRHPVEVGRGEEAHLAMWLSNRMDRDISAPDFTTAGLDLVGGRLLPSSAGPSAQFMYERRTGERVTLYVRYGDARPRGGVRASNGDLNAVIWSQRDLNYAIIGAVDTSELAALSRLAELEERGAEKGSRT